MRLALLYCSVIVLGGCNDFASRLTADDDAGAIESGGSPRAGRASDDAGPVGLYDAGIPLRDASAAKDSGIGQEEAGMGTRDAGDAGKAGPTPTFEDDFSTLSLHRNVEAGDNWGLCSPGTPDGRGGPLDSEYGDQWWTNPFNPATPIQGLYSDSNGEMLLGLLPTPAEDAAYIGSNAGTNLPYVGTLLNSATSCYQLFGYWEVTVAVDKLPGFAFQACLESWELSHSWPPEIDVRVYTDGSGAEWAFLAVDTGTGNGCPGGIDCTPTTIPIDAKMHAYGVDWESDFITFYVDRTQVFQVPTPTDGTYTNYPAYWYLLTGANYIDLGADPDPASLPAYAHVDSVVVWQSRPFATSRGRRVHRTRTVRNCGAQLLRISRTGSFPGAVRTAMRRRGSLRWVTSRHSDFGPARSAR